MYVQIIFFNRVNCRGKSPPVRKEEVSTKFVHIHTNISDVLKYALVIRLHVVYYFTVYVIVLVTRDCFSALYVYLR